MATQQIGSPFYHLFGEYLTWCRRLFVSAATISPYQYIFGASGIFPSHISKWILKDPVLFPEIFILLFSRALKSFHLSCSQVVYQIFSFILLVVNKNNKNWHIKNQIADLISACIRTGEKVYSNISINVSRTTKILKLCTLFFFFLKENNVILHCITINIFPTHL